MLFDDLIIPGKHGVGKRGFTATTEGYRDAADSLVQLHDEGSYVDIHDYNVRRVMNLYGASSIEELKIKLRGW